METKAIYENEYSLLRAFRVGRYEEVLDFLLGNETKNNDKLLLLACQIGHHQIVSLLLEKNGDVNVSNHNNITPLHLACQNGHHQIVSLLLEKSADVNVLNKNKMTPLHFVCRNGHHKTASLLLENNADVNTSGKYNLTPLHLACRNGHHQIVSLLLEKNADVNVSNQNNITPLHFACQNGQHQIVSLLLEKNADVNALNNNNFSPFYLAYSNNKVKIVKILLGTRAIIPPTFFTNDMMLNGLLKDQQFFEIMLKRMGAVDENALTICLESVEKDEGLLDLLLHRISRTDRTVFDELVINYPQLRGVTSGILKDLVKKLPLDKMRLHFCGPGCAGKTTLRYQLQHNLNGLKKLREKPIAKTRTNGIEIESNFSLRNGKVVTNYLQHTFNAFKVLGGIAFRERKKKKIKRLDQLKFSLFDHGGQQEFHVTYNEMFVHPMSIFLLVIPVTFDSVCDKSGTTFLARSSVESICHQLEYWLGSLTSLVHPTSSRIIIILNIIGPLVKEELRFILINCQKTLEDCEKSNESLRGKLVYKDFSTYQPLVLSCASEEELEDRLYPILQETSNILFRNEFSIPKLCSTVAAAVLFLRSDVLDKDTRIVPNTFLFNFLRNYDESLRYLSDASISTLLRYLEQLGEVLLVSGSKSTAGSEIVVLHPQWFFSKVIGTLFRFEYFEDRKEMIQSIDTIRDHLSLHRSDELKKHTDDVIAVLHRMRLCVPMPRVDSSEDQWFMSFMEHHKFAESQNQGGLDQELLIEEFWKSGMDLKEKSSDFICSGRLVSLTPIDKTNRWNHFLPGSFSRFQMIVAEKFLSLTQDPQQLYILIVSPFRLSLSYESNNERAEIFIQMMIDEKTKMQTCCRIWLQASSEKACEGLIGDHCPSDFEDLFSVDKVLEHFLGWFRDACKVIGTCPDLFFYCISPGAIGKKHEETYLSSERKKWFYDLDKTRQNLKSNPAEDVFSRRLCGDRCQKNLKDESSENKSEIFVEILDQLKDLQMTVDSIIRDKKTYRNEEIQHYQQLEIIKHLVQQLPFTIQQNQQGKESELLKRLKELMIEIVESVSDLHSPIDQQSQNMENILSTLRELENPIASNNQLIRSAFKEPLNMPRLFVLLPSKSNTTRMTNTLPRPLKWLTTTHYKLFFVCPVTGKPCGTNKGEGYELYLPVELIRSYGPALKQSLSYLGVISDIGCKMMKRENLAEPFINNIKGELDHAMEASSLAEFLEELKALTLDTPVANIDDVTPLDIKPDELTGAAYRALSAELLKIDPTMKDCGLEWVQSDNLGEDTFMTWVSEEGREKFKKEGKKALLNSGKSTT